MLAEHTRPHRMGTGEMTQRVRRLRDQLFNNPPVLSTARLKYLREVYGTYEAEPSIIKRARLFEQHLLQMTIYINENPIVGSITEQLVAAYPEPEFSTDWMLKNTVFSSQLGAISCTPDDIKLLKEAAGYWKDKNVHRKAEEVFSQIHRGQIDPIALHDAGVFGDVPNGHPLGVGLDYARVLEQGINGLIAEAEEERAKLIQGLQDDEHKRTFYDAVLICLNAVIAWADRYASLATDMALREGDRTRENELLRIAEACRRIPALPARNYREAIQAFWFTYACAHITHIGVGMVPGRLGQYLDPFYQKDRAAGELTREEAVELLEFLFLRLQAIVPFRSGSYHQHGMGQTNIHITLGGLTVDGQDATCEMDQLLLEAQRRVRCIQPTLSVLVHNQMSDEFLLQCIDVVRETGLGQPAFMNNDVAIQGFLFQNPGASFEDARGINLFGCVPPKAAHKTDPIWNTGFNVAKMLELALSDGKDPRTGVQLGPRTGAISTYDDLEGAIRQQLRYFLRISRELGRLGHTFTGRIAPVPFHSSLLDDCIRKGKDIYDGGARYQWGGSNNPVGVIDVANSLAAIKRLVFEKQVLTLGKLREALRANFEGDGYAEIQQMCLSAPKFGNDDLYVDQIARRWYDIYWEEERELVDFLGRPTIVTAFSISYHFRFGQFVGALPSGRKAGTALTDATVSATAGTDTNGPTALAKSAARGLDTLKYNCNHLNMKFHPSALSTPSQARKLLALIKTYMDLGGYHIQFNVVSSKKLKDAQLHPENYRDLVVRVAGFSAFFVLLESSIQDEIIRRTELSFV